MTNLRIPALAAALLASLSLPALAQAPATGTTVNAPVHRITGTTEAAKPAADAKAPIAKATTPAKPATTAATPATPAKPAVKTN